MGSPVNNLGSRNAVSLPSSSALSKKSGSLSSSFPTGKIGIIIVIIIIVKIVVFKSLRIK